MVLPQNVPGPRHLAPDDIRGTLPKTDLDDARRRVANERFLVSTEEPRNRVAPPVIQPSQLLSTKAGTSTIGELLAKFESDPPVDPSKREAFLVEIKQLRKDLEAARSKEPLEGGAENALIIRTVGLLARS